jgi:hypothetical protein
VKIFEASLIYYTSGRAGGQAEGRMDGLHFYGWVNEQAVDLLMCCEQLPNVIFYLQKIYSFGFPNLCRKDMSLLCSSDEHGP